MEQKEASTSHTHLFRAYMDRQIERKSHQHPAAMSDSGNPLKPQFYVVRQNGDATPLIAIDELPQHISIEGAPRMLSVADIDDMIRMPGKYEVRQKVYTVVDTSTTSPIPVIVPTETGFGFPRPKVIVNDHTTSISDDEQIFPGPKKYFGIDEEAPKEPSEPAKQEVASKSDAAFDKFEPLPGWKATQNIGDRKPLKGKKIYCSHWMSTGECDYAQQGCLYKHEMPLDIELLQHLGFRDIPKWYRERHGIGKLTAVPGSGAHIEGPTSPPGHMHSTWRPLVNQRLPRASPLAIARIRALPPHANRRSTSTVLSRRSNHDLQQDLISLESRPVSPVTAGQAGPSKSLLNSKFASLRPNHEPTKRHDASSSSSPESIHAHITPRTSIESLSALKLRDLPLHAASRRTSIATDYETALFQEQNARDEQEFQAAAELDAIAASKREQAVLKQKQEAALAIAKQTMLNGQITGVDAQRRSAGSLKKGRRRSGPVRNLPKRSESEKSSAEIHA